MRVAVADMSSLPEDPTALRALLLSVIAERDSLAAERDALAVRNEQLHHLLLKLKRRQFGAKSERLPEDQLLFAFEEIEATLAGNAAEAGKASPALRANHAKRRREGRGRLPAHLPRVEQVLVPEATACPCCQGPLVEIGVDAAERLDVIPGDCREFRVRPFMMGGKEPPHGQAESTTDTGRNPGPAAVWRGGEHRLRPGRSAGSVEEGFGGCRGRRMRGLFSMPWNRRCMSAVRRGAA